MPAHVLSKQFVLKTLAVFAYLACLLQWSLVMLPLIPSVVDSETFHTFVIPQEQTSQAPVPDVTALPSWVVLVLAAILVVAMVVVVWVSFRRLPRSIGETAQKMTHKTAGLVVPVVTHRKKIPEEKRRILTARIIFDIKLLLLAVPVIISLVLPLGQMPITHDLFVFTIAVLGGWALVLFCLQVVFARAFRVPLGTLW